jgi:hypothetical protein
VIRAKEEAKRVKQAKISISGNYEPRTADSMNGILASRKSCCPAGHSETKKWQELSQLRKRLLKTLNLILDLSRVEANKQDIKLKRWN